MMDLISLVTTLLRTYSAVAATAAQIAKGSRIDSAEGFVAQFPSQAEENNTKATLLFVEKMEGAAGLPPP